MATYSQQDRKRFRAIGHQLRPVVTVGGKGLTDQLMNELDRALSDHELIKIKIVGDRAERSEMIASILEITGATCIQSVGGMFLILRSAATPKPHLSNLIRHG